MKTQERTMISKFIIEVWNHFSTQQLKNLQLCHCEDKKCRKERRNLKMVFVCRAKVDLNYSTFIPTSLNYVQ